MARSSPIINALNGGELSPNIDGRTDLAKYFSGCKRLENMLMTVQGPGVRRGGTRYVAAVKNSSDRTWLIKFEFSATQCFHLEFGDGYVRFYTNHGVLLSGMSPYEIVSPYALADLTLPDGSCALAVVQSGDVLYIANAYRTYKPQTLTRVANTNWVFADYAPSNGPFLPQNSGATTLIASAASGSVTLTASASTFASTDVGRLVRLDVLDLDTKPWETNKSYSIGDLVRYDGKTYKALNAVTSGTSPPVHERGKAYDGKAGVQWEYQNPGYGVLRITAYTSATQVTASVLTDSFNGLNVLPTEVTSTATTRWQLGEWSDTTGYPGAVAFFRNRLFWAGGTRLWGSVPDDYSNMAPDFFGEVTADAAITRTVAGQDVNDITFLVGADKLVIGTGGGEFVAGEITTSEPMGPANFSVLPQSSKRGRSVRPQVIGTSVVYVQRAGRKLLSMNYSFDIDRFSSADLVVLADRVTRSGIVDMAFQGEPYSILWCVRSDGKLLAFTYDQEQQVTGWARHPIGGDGIVESVSVGPTPDGAREELWMIVRRTINGATVRYVEYLERPWEGEDEDGTAGDAPEDMFYVDSGLTYDGAATTSITGLDHLEGETVQILADGARQPDQTVNGGAITLTRAASVVHAGLQFVSRVVPMRFEAGGTDGTAQGKIKRVHEVIVRLLDTIGGSCGRYGGTLDDLSERQPATAMGSPPAAYSGDRRINFGGDYDRDALLEIVQDAPLPMTIVAIMPQMRTYP